MGHIAFKIDAETEVYLREIQDKTGDGSLNLIAKKLIKWCLINDINPSENPSFFDGDTRKMIEHIHLSIPHLMLSSSVNSLVAMDDIQDEKKKELSEKAIARLNQRCGDFQNINYKKVSVKFNQTGLKEAPENEEITEWKYPQT